MHTPVAQGKLYSLLNQWCCILLMQPEDTHKLFDPSSFRFVHLCFLRRNDAFLYSKTPIHCIR